MVNDACEVRRASGLSERDVAGIRGVDGAAQGHVWAALSGVAYIDTVSFQSLNACGDWGLLKYLY